MQVALTVRLPADSRAPGLARKALEALNGELEGVREPVRLLVSEMVTNAVRHAGLRPDDQIELEVATAPSAVRIEVADPGPGFEPPAQPEPGPEGGFGLFFVDELSDRWGTDGSRVWFELERPA